MTSANADAWASACWGGTPAAFKVLANFRVSNVMIAIGSPRVG